MMNCVIWKGNSVAFTVDEFSFDDWKPEGLRQKHAVATWNLGTITAFA
jgi:hypothetical protein